MKHTMSFTLIMMLSLSACRTQDSMKDRFLRDEAAQDEIIGAVVGKHELMMKLIDAIKKSEHASMMINHLLRVVPSSPADSAGTQSPYAGDERRALKALGPEQIQEYLQGEGMGLAMPAELNHYPGPRHVLDLASDLHLTGDQKTKAQALFDAMHERAVTLGKNIVDAEETLDKQFAEGSITRQRLKLSLDEIARYQGELRAAHLGAHLGMKELLTADQVTRYDSLRGYGRETMDHQMGGER